MSSLSEDSLTLIGIGHRNMGDDAIGLVILEHLAETNRRKNVDIQLWETKDALSVAAELLEIHNPVVLVDCADMGLKAGEFRWFRQSECQLKQHFQSMSTHGFGFSEALKLAQTLGFKQELYFFAVQPEQLEINQGLSPALKNNIGLFADHLSERLEKL